MGSPLGAANYISLLKRAASLKRLGTTSLNVYGETSLLSWNIIVFLYPITTWFVPLFCMCSGLCCIYGKDIVYYRLFGNTLSPSHTACAASTYRRYCKYKHHFWKQWPSFQSVIYTSARTPKYSAQSHKLLRPPLANGEYFIYLRTFSVIELQL